MQELPRVQEGSSSKVSWWREDFKLCFQGQLSQQRLLWIHPKRPKRLKRLTRCDPHLGTNTPRIAALRALHRWRWRRGMKLVCSRALQRFRSRGYMPHLRPSKSDGSGLSEKQGNKVGAVEATQYTPGSTGVCPCFPASQRPMWRLAWQPFWVKLAM